MSSQKMLKRSKTPAPIAPVEPLAPSAKFRTTIVIDSTVLGHGKELAQRERRNFSNFLEVLIERERVRVLGGAA
jgi:hypothetical protein